MRKYVLSHNILNKFSKKFRSNHSNLKHFITFLFTIFSSKTLFKFFRLTIHKDISYFRPR